MTKSARAMNDSQWSGSQVSPGRQTLVADGSLAFEFAAFVGSTGKISVRVKATPPEVEVIYLVLSFWISKTQSSSFAKFLRILTRYSVGRKRTRRRCGAHFFNIEISHPRKGEKPLCISYLSTCLLKRSPHTVLLLCTAATMFQREECIGLWTWRLDVSLCWLLVCWLAMQQAAGFTTCSWEKLCRALL